jgi:hypothetical protein
VPAAGPEAQATAAGLTEFEAAPAPQPPEPPPEPRPKRPGAVAALRGLGASVRLDEDGYVTTLYYPQRHEAKVTDANLVHLRGMSRLKGLRLSKTEVTDEGLVNLADLTQLERLFLCDTGVGDAGLKHLEGLPRLKSLYL